MFMQVKLFSHSKFDRGMTLVYCLSVTFTLFHHIVMYFLSSIGDTQSSKWKKKKIHFFFLFLLVVITH